MRGALLLLHLPVYCGPAASKKKKIYIYICKIKKKKKKTALCLHWCLWKNTNRTASKMEIK